MYIGTYLLLLGWLCWMHIALPTQLLNFELQPDQYTYLPGPVLIDRHSSTERCIPKKSATEQSIARRYGKVACMSRPWGSLLPCSLLASNINDTTREHRHAHQIIPGVMQVMTFCSSVRSNSALGTVFFSFSHKSYTDTHDVSMGLERTAAGRESSLSFDSRGPGVCRLYPGSTFDGRKNAPYRERGK